MIPDTQSCPKNVDSQNIHSLTSKEFFERFSANHSSEPKWLADLRRESWSLFLQGDDKNLKDERWRFSPKSRFGYPHSNTLSDSSDSIEFRRMPSDQSVRCSSIHNILNQDIDLLSEFVNSPGPDLGASQTFHLSNSYFNNGYFMHVPKNFSQNVEISVDHTCPKKNEVTFHRNFIALEDFAELTIVENFISKSDEYNGALSNLSNFILGKGSKLTRIVIQNLAEGATFHNLENFDLHGDARCTNVECYLGGSQSRIETKGKLIGKGSNFENFSFVSGQSDQIFDQRTAQHHLAPHCTSNLLSKNVLQDKSKSIFSGLIKVEKDAQHTNALQTNRNLVLTKEAEADSLPGLEILANDVKCTHGATTSRLDQEELFYLLSRGIDKKTSEYLISLGFIEEIINQIPIDELSSNLRDIVSSNFKHP